MHLVPVYLIRVRSVRYLTIPLAFKKLNAVQYQATPGVSKPQASDIPSSNRRFPRELQAITRLQPTSSSWLQAITRLQTAFSERTQNYNRLQLAFLSRFQAITGLQPAFPSGFQAITGQNQRRSSGFRAMIERQPAFSRISFGVDLTLVHWLILLPLIPENYLLIISSSDLLTYY